MRVTVISPERSLFDDEADAVVVPAYDGLLGILPHHAPLMTLLGTGILRVRQRGETKRLLVSAGFLQVVGEVVRVVADSVETA